MGHPARYLVDPRSRVQGIAGLIGHHQGPETFFGPKICTTTNGRCIATLA